MPQVVPVREFKVRDDEAIRRAVARSNVVINLLGVDKETMNFSFEDVHIDAAARVARISAENGILERFLHVSHIASAPDHPSRRLRTKVRRP
jgi:NADH dehydrogenase (ubiquinone) 1 alpha subcomplex subunit 9